MRDPSHAEKKETWAELVFHVLAHVPCEGAAPASLHWFPYVQWCGETLGPAQNRDLGAACSTLAQALPSHELLRDVQWLAWLFSTPARATICINRSLKDLNDEDVDDVEALRGLKMGKAVAAAELVRGAAILESVHHARLATNGLQAADLAESLKQIEPVVPLLGFHAIKPLRPLGPHGRVYRNTIYSGVAGLWEGVPLLTHVVWQIAHEATVVEAQAALRRSARAARSERDAEHLALHLLARRVQATAWSAAHAQWLATRGPDAVALATAVLEPSLYPLLMACLNRES